MVLAVTLKQKHLGIIVLTILVLCGTLSNACRPSDERSTPVDDGFPLQCVACSFVQNRGPRILSGEVRNNSKAPIDAISLEIEFNDSNGNLVVNERHTLPTLNGIQPATIRQFSVTLTNTQPVITQATLQFKRSDTGQPLSQSIPVLLAVSLDSDDEP